MAEKPATPEQARRWSDRALEMAIILENGALENPVSARHDMHSALWYYDLAEAYDTSARSRGA